MAADSDNGIDDIASLRARFLGYAGHDARARRRMYASKCARSHFGKDSLHDMRRHASAMTFSRGWRY